MQSTLSVFFNGSGHPVAFLCFILGLIMMIIARMHEHYRPSIGSMPTERQWWGSYGITLSLGLTGIIVFGTGLYFVQP